MILRLIVFIILSQVAFSDAYCEPDSTFIDLLGDKGYEIHTVVTKDGYELKVYRVQRSFPIEQTKSKTILLNHGIMDSSDGWAINTKSNLVTALTNKDYDVWLMNNRGNKYSCTGRQISSNQPEFWDYSFPQMAKFDFTDTVDYITKKVGQKLFVIGHSQGTAQVFAALSENTQLQEKIERFHAAAPIAYFIEFDKEQSYYYFLSMHNFIDYVKYAGIKKILESPFDANFLEDWAIKLFCIRYKEVCNFLISSFTDGNFNNLDMEQGRLFMKNYPSRVSIHNLEHFTQLIKNNDGRMLKFDHGATINQQLYDSDTPPEYDLNKVKVPCYLYHGDQDLLSTEKAIHKLKETLPLVKSRFYQGWGHWSWYIAKEIEQFVDKVIEDIEEEMPMFNTLM